MNKSGPIVIIEDDNDDRDILMRVFRMLKFTNEIKFLVDGAEAYEYLTTAKIKPFLILSDINIPKLNGLELKEKLGENDDLKLRYTPFIFFSASASGSTITDAYSKQVQGFFIKPIAIEDLARMIKIIIDYWQICEAPADVV